MMKMEAGVKQFGAWLKDKMAKGNKVGVDEAQFELNRFNKTKDLLSEVEVELVAGDNLVDLVWSAERPSIPAEKVWHLEDKYSGQPTLSKYDDLAKEIPDSDALLITTLDDIAWLLNLRGNDISYNPLFFSYLLFHKKANGEHCVDLFIDATKLENVADYIKSIRANVHSYDSIKTFIASVEKGTKVTVDPANCNVMLNNALKEAGLEVKCSGTNLVEHLKARKNPVMQEGMKQANIRDCAAIMKYMSWLEEQLKNPDHGIDEFDGSMKVLEYRKNGSDMFLQPSFCSISSIGSNGAVIHYSPQKGTAKAMNNKEVYLLDSGGQYLDGTTDITRTVHFTEATDF